jgi:hypothetical protein
MWDDFSPFIAGTGPSSTVLDADLNQNNILDRTLANSVRVDWTFSGGGQGFLDATNFTVSLYADPVGPGANVMVGSAQVDGTNYVPVPPGTRQYSQAIPIAPNSLAAGAYRLTALVTNAMKQPPAPPPPPPPLTAIAGFVDGPIIQAREHV